MSFNFFDWVRDGVKNSVLLGVSDAANAMGMAPEESSKDKILRYFGSNTDNDLSAKRVVGSTTGTKKLGRSLSDIAMKDAS